MNVLLTSVGRRVALIRAFQRELSKISPNGKVLAADMSSMSAAFCVADEGFLVPPCDAPTYIPALLSLVESNDVDVLIPLIDTELLLLAQQNHEFLKRGCQVLVSDASAVEVTRDKRRMSRALGTLGFNAPTTFEDEALLKPDDLPYPLFIKPAEGSSSVGAARLDSANELRFFLRRTRSPVVQSLVHGDEFSIDVFVDLHSRVRCVVPRRRLEVRAGEMSKGRTERDTVLMQSAKQLVEALGGCRGCVTLQCFRRADSEPIYFDVNLRFGGGYPLSYAAGANYPRWILEMCAGKEVSEFDDWRDGLVMLRYDEAIFVEPTT